MRFGIGTACVGVALVAASAAGAQTPNISGVWRVQGQIRYGAVFESDQPTCTFRQSGGVLGGVCVGPHARGPLSGMIAGNRVSWTWSHAATTVGGLNGRTQFNGTYVNGRLIKGSMSSTAIPGVGSFVQTR